MLLTYEDQSAQDRSAPWDLIALLLAGFGCAAAFFGASQLATHAALSLIVFVPLVAGLLALVLLRAVAAFMTAPIVLHVAMTTNGGLQSGGIATGM